MEDRRFTVNNDFTGNNDFTQQYNNFQQGYQPMNNFQQEYQPMNNFQQSYQQNYQQGNGVDNNVGEGPIFNLILGETSTLSLCANGKLVSFREIRGNDLLQAIYNTMTEMVPTWSMQRLNILVRPQIVKIEGGLSHSNIVGYPLGTLGDKDTAKWLALGMIDVNSLLQLKQLSDVKEVRIITPQSIHARALEHEGRLILMDETMLPGLAYFETISDGHIEFINNIAPDTLEQPRRYMMNRNINKVVDFTCYYPANYRARNLSNIDWCFQDNRFSNYMRNKLFVTDLMCSVESKSLEELMNEKERAMPPTSFNENQFMPDNQETMVIDRQELNDRLAEEQSGKKGILGMFRKNKR